MPQGKLILFAFAKNVINTKRTYSLFKPILNKQRSALLNKAIIRVNPWKKKNIRLPNKA